MSFKNSISDILGYAARGWRVYPIHTITNGACSCPARAACRHAGKHPVTANGFHDATTDEGVIRQWAATLPGANVGIATGEGSGLLVLDIDGPAGRESLARLEQGHGPLPDTPRVQTGRADGGVQHYFAYPAGSGVKSDAGLFAGIDYRGEGGGVVAAPSGHRSGRTYSWLTDPNMEVAPAPAWLVAAILAHQTGPQPKPTPAGPLSRLRVQPDADLTTHPGVGEGERNKTLCRLLGPHLGRGEDAEAVEELAVAWGERCVPPLGEEEVRRVVRSVERKEWAKAERTRTGPATLVVGGEPEGKKGGLRVTITEDRSPGLTPGLLSFLPAPATGERDEGREVVTQHPVLSPEVYHGLVGEIVRAVEPETEADPAGVLVCLLAGIGSAVGRGPHFSHGKRHGANLFAVVVGDTASRKGTAWAVASRLLKKADPEWAERCVAYGFGSGEGLVHRIRDDAERHEAVKEKGVVAGYAPVVVPGVADKRLMMVEEEFAKVFKLARQERSTLTPIIRNAYDAIPLEFANKGDNAYRVREPHVSILGQITPQELRRCLEGSAYLFDGFGNRFLYVLVKRTRFLPRGGEWGVIDPFAGRLAEAVAAAKTAGLLKLSAEAGAVWDAAYPTLERAKPGEYGLAVARGSDQVMKLSLIFALVDGATEIGVGHLRAGRAVWDYCDRSAWAIFGNHADNTPFPPQEEPLWLTVLNQIGRSPGLSKSDLLRANRRNTADEIAGALAYLETHGLAHPQEDDAEGPGRRAERWHTGRKEGKNDGTVQGPISFLPSPPTTPGPTSGDDDPTVERDGSEGKNPADAVPLVATDGKEGKNGEAGAEPSSFLPSLGEAVSRPVEVSGEKGEGVVTPSAGCAQEADGPTLAFLNMLDAAEEPVTELRLKI